MAITSIIFAAGAVSALISTGVPPGTGENYCHLTWDKQCCPIPGCDVSIAPGVLTICNEKPEPAEFFWELIDISGLGLQFMPQSGIAAPGMDPTGISTGPCIDIPFTVICPPNFPLGTAADYQAIVTKVGTNETFTCFGNVRNASELKLDPAGDPVIDVPIPLAGAQATAVRGQLVVSNLGSSGKDDGSRLYIVPMGPFAVAQATLDIPPIPPGSSWAVDSFFDVSFSGARRGAGVDLMGDILFMIDTDGDNVGDTVIGSQTVRGVPTAAPCVGDLNGDGVIDTADLGILLGVFGAPCP